MSLERSDAVTLYRLSYKDGKPVETAVQTWNVETNDQGYANQSLTAKQAGQYRLSFELTDTKKQTIEGGYVFLVRGAGVVGNNYKFNDLELVTDKREYAPGDKVKLLINTNTIDSTVLLFVRSTNGVYLSPKVIRMKGKSVVEEITVVQKDMPNFFVEAVCIHGGKVHTELREIVVPPENRILNVEVMWSIPFVPMHFMRRIGSAPCSSGLISEPIGASLISNESRIGGILPAK